jgi:tetratricopeptide (TPR) repeat protein
MSTAGAIAVPFGAPSIAPPAHSAGAVSTGAPAPSSPAISMPFAASSVANGAAAPVASIPTNGATSPAGSIPMNGAATSSVAPPALGGGFEEFELVEDEEGMDLLRELEVELGLDAGRKNLLEPVDRATSPGELARAYFQMRLYDKALEQLELLKAHGPLDADSQWLIGRCLFQQGELADAVRCYQTVLNRNDLTTSQELEVLFDLGLAYEAQSEYNLALDLFEEIASIDETFREKEVQARLAEIAARLTSGRAGSVQTAR